MSTFKSSLLALALLSLPFVGCVDQGTGPDFGSAVKVGSVTAALTAEQCTYFGVDDRVTICHAMSSARNPYVIIRTSTEGCAEGHADHDGDYITSSDPSSPLYDPTCQGLGCFPEGAPHDGTVACCDGLAPADDGTCAAVDPCLGGSRVTTFADDDFDYATTPPAGDAWTDDFTTTESPLTFSSATFTLAAAAGEGHTETTPDDPYWDVTLVHSGGTFLHAWDVWGAATWDPSSQGAIAGIEVEYAARLESWEVARKSDSIFRSGDPGQGANMQFALIQDGVVYTRSLAFLCPSGVDCDQWRVVSGAWDEPNLGNLSNAVSGTGTLDLSTTGGPITFGFLIGHSHGNADYIFRSRTYVDDFKVTIYSKCD